MTDMTDFKLKTVVIIGIIIINIIINVLYFSFIYKPKNKPIDTLEKQTAIDTLYTPTPAETVFDTVFIPQIVDTAAIIQDYFSKRIYNENFTKIIDNKEFKINITDTLQRNIILNRGFEIEYKYLNLPRNYNFGIITGTNVNFSTQKTGLNFGLFYEKKQSRYSITYDPFNKQININYELKFLK